MRLLVTTGLPLATGIIGASIELAWPSPTRPDDQLHVELEVTDVRVSKSDPRRGFITTAYDTLNQHGDVRQAHHGSTVGVREAAMIHLTGSAGYPSDDIVEGLRITVYSQLAHTGRVEDTALVTDDAGKGEPCQPHGTRCGRAHSMKMRIRAPLAYSAEVVRK